jgi:hypothetical protein
MWKVCVIYCTDKVFVYGKVTLQIIWINPAEDRGQRSRGSLVSIETRSRAGRFASRQGKLFFSSPKLRERFMDAPRVIFNGWRGSFPGVKRPGCEDLAFIYCRG